MHSSNILYGRSSSHFTRVARIFAAELSVPYTFQIVRDLFSLDSDDYGGHPALKLPALQTRDARWFGTLNICRELARQSHRQTRIVWPEALATPVLANAQELVLHAMSTEVTLVMSKVGGGTTESQHQQKMTASLAQSMAWLEHNMATAIAALARDLSFLEVTLFCLVEHLEFREVLSMRGYPVLRQLASEFSNRASAKQTAYRFDT